MGTGQGAGEGGGAGRVLVGIDTGGTYTDAVVISERAAAGHGGRDLIAKAKRLTTHTDLAEGIGAALDAVLAEARVEADRVALVSLSTTLATNALVEGRGGRAGLVMIGFDQADVVRQGLGEALRDEPLIRVAGGHDSAGSEQAAFGQDALSAALDDLAAGDRPVEGMAVCGHFAVRNPAHEEAARALIRQRLDVPVTCSHNLSAKVGGPKRALTALLNARLIGLIDALIAAAQGLIGARGIAAPLMVVRGDGALVSAEMARERPIETILSGPAASLVGASWLTGAPDAVVSDIGGTTTDIAVIAGGRPRLDPDGAAVGGWRTMVEAVAMRTHGLGGDSEVHLDERAEPRDRLRLGPRRAVPVSLLAVAHAQMVHKALDRQLRNDRPSDLDGRFVIPMGAAPAGLTGREAALVEELSDGPRPASEVLRVRTARVALRQLVDRGAVRVAAFTPSDAAHLAGPYAAWDGAAAEKAAALLARRSGPDGKPVAEDARDLARRVLSTLERRSAEVLVDAAVAEDGIEAPEFSKMLPARLALDGHRGLLCPSVSLSVPLIGLGASAPTYYPGIARLLGAEAQIPQHADVANAIGAVAGQIEIRRQATVSVPAEGRFRVHLSEGPQDFEDLDPALAAAEARLMAEARATGRDAGADELELTAARDVREVVVDGRPMVVEAVVAVTGIGRPRLAEAEPEPAAPLGL